MSLPLKVILFLYFLLPGMLVPRVTVAQQNGMTVFDMGKKNFRDEILKPRHTTTAGITSPPSSPVRAMAEWEEIQAIAITWTGDTSALSQLLKIIKYECRIIINCSDSNAVKNSLVSDSVPLTNIAFIQQPFNSIWIRDYGPQTVYSNDVDSIFLVDWMYNLPNPDDDTVSGGIAKFLNVPLYQTFISPNDLMNTGGNFTTDGFGTAFSSKLIFEENDGNGGYLLNYPNHNENEIDSIMKSFMGIERYIKFDTLLYDGIHQLDRYLKFLNEETLLVGEYPAGVSDGPQIEANIQYVLSNFQSVFGSPYKIVRIIQPPDSNALYPPSGENRNYVNSIIANKKVIIPLFDEKYDTIALRIYRENMPGYEIDGVNCNQIIREGGSLHRITHEIGADDPLLISHHPLKNTFNSSVPYQVDAYINHKSGIAGATLFYTYDTTLGFAQGPMGLFDSSNNAWTGFIIEAPAGTTIYYYIEASANSGKTQVRPVTAPKGVWQFTVVENTAVNSDKKINVELSVFPNPAGAITCVPVTTDPSCFATLKIIDVLCNEALVLFEGIIEPGESKFFFDAGALRGGAYLLILETDNAKLTKKLMIK